MCALVPEQMAPLKRRQESRPHKILGVGYSLLPGTLFIMAALISGGHFPHSPVGEESACNAGDRFDSWVGKIHWRRDRLPTPVFLGFPCGSAGKESACNEGDLENSMDCIVCEVTKSQTRLSDFHFHFSLFL